MNQKLKGKILESLAAVLPVTGIVLVLSVLFVPMDLGVLVVFLTSAVLLIIGMGLFQMGAEMAMTPLGEGIGVQMARTRRIVPALLIGFLMGVVITVSEPDLSVLAQQVPAIPNQVLILTVAVGVGIFLALAIFRILARVNLSVMLTACYGLILLVAVFAPENFLAVAFDSGGVTTGPMTVPFIIALGVGIASIRSDKEAAQDSFGLVAVSSVGPVLAVLVLGNFYDTSEAVYEGAVIPEVATTRDVLREFAVELPAFAREVLVSLAPILAVFVVFQLASRRYQRRQIRRILVGFGYTCLGLVLFLCGANVGFAPVGTLLGRDLASLAHNWVLVPVSMLIGYYIVKAEPAIQVLNRQVEEVTNGIVSQRAMNRCLQVGVSVSAGLSMLRVLTGIPIQYFLVPGYLLALALSWAVPKIFVGIAFDSGGVASGPMTSTFLLPLCIGACNALGGDLMTEAFGVVALVALTPLIAVQLMGLKYRFEMGRAQPEAVPLGEALEQEEEIVDFEEESE